MLFALLITTLALVPGESNEPADGPVRVGVAGLTHGHVGWILGREDDGVVEIVGIAEPDAALAAAYAERFGFDLSLVYPSLEEMIVSARPEAITAFNDVAGHLEVVEIAARHGVHVMVEKPLHFSLAAARRMKALADSAGIHLLTNYETTWYPSTLHAGDLVASGDLGHVRKIVVHDGHQGPHEIGVGPEFLAWLTDPERNGGGALIDFGCYGANLITWLMGGRRPSSVTAVVQTLKPDLYPDVDDEATIILTYPDAQGIIQASWNWPFSRKDMEVYGTLGALWADNATQIRSMRQGEVVTQTLPSLPDLEQRDPFAFLAGVVRGRIDPRGSLSALELNMTVAEILDAARRSALESRVVFLEPSSE